MLLKLNIGVSLFPTYWSLHIRISLFQVRLLKSSKAQFVCNFLIYNKDCSIERRMMNVILISLTLFIVIDKYLLYLINKFESSLKTQIHLFDIQKTPTVCIIFGDYYPRKNEKINCFGWFHRRNIKLRKLSQWILLIISLWKF